MGSSWVRAAVAAFLLAVSAAGCGGGKRATATVSDPPAVESQLHGLVPEPLPRRPTFTLTDTAGRPYAFAARTQGKLAYLYFGYTHCPDACPATMDDIAFAVRSLPRAQRGQVDVVFVTVDPRRDSRRVLRTWLDHYGTSFVGLTGSARQIRMAEQAAGVPVAPPGPQSGAGYTVAHSSLVFPYSPDGVAHVVYTQGFVSTDYAHDLPLLLQYGVPARP
jgi:protein SCO1/2